LCANNVSSNGEGADLGISHGFIDIVFSSHNGIPESFAIAQILQSSSNTELELESPTKKRRTEDESDGIYLF
jgi:hypothetical protein